MFQFEIFFDMLNGDPLPGGDNDRILAVPEYNNGTEGCDQVLTTFHYKENTINFHVFLSFVY